MLNELLPEEKRKLHDLECKISDFEKGITKNVTFPDLVFEHQQLVERLGQLEVLLQKEPRGKIDNFRRRISHLKNTTNHLKSNLDAIAIRHNFINYESQRNALMGNATHSSNKDLELEMAENGSLSRSSAMVDDYLSIGKSTLDELVSQRERLKSIQKRALDIFNYLGLSNNLMKGMENREVIDRWIVYIGMFVILIVIVLVYVYYRK